MGHKMIKESTTLKTEKKNSHIISFNSTNHSQHTIGYKKTKYKRRVA